VKFDDLRPGLTIEEQVDEVTGLSQDVVTLPPGDEKHQPAILVRDSSGKVRKKYLMPSRAHLMVKDGDEVQAGDVLREDPARTTKTKDITAVSRALSSFSRPQTQGSGRHQRNRRRRPLWRYRQGHAQSLRRERGWQDHQGILHPRGVHINVQEGTTSRPVRPSSMARSTCTTCSPSSAKSSRNRTC